MLYEMLTGQSPFKAEYENAVLYSILNSEPEPITGLRTGVRWSGAHCQQAPRKGCGTSAISTSMNILVDLRVLRTSPSDRTTSPAATPDRVVRPVESDVGSS